MGENKLFSADFKNDEKIIFFSSSITHSGYYFMDFQQVYALNHSGHSVRMINGGVAGGSAEQGMERIEFDILAQKPDRVFICFGMNEFVPRKVLSCPASQVSNPKYDTYDAFYYSYGMASWSTSTQNFNQSAPNELIDITRNLDKRGFGTASNADNGLGTKTFAPSQTVMFMDTFQSSTGFQCYGVIPRRAGYAYQAAARHNSRANACMNDGSVRGASKGELVGDYGFVDGAILVE